jgi:lactoylglutathione lyase
MKPKGTAAADTSPSNAEWPIPKEGVSVTHLLIVRDVARSRRFYSEVLGATVLLEGPTAILRFYNSWLILSTEGGPTDDRPGIAAIAPNDTTAITSALNLRVADIFEFYELWRSRGAEFLTPPKEHASEIRCYLRDPDGHLIELGQAKQEAKQQGKP